MRMNGTGQYSLNTRIIHADADSRDYTGAIMTPIYQTSTFVQDTIGEQQDYNYSRSGNPTRAALENAVARLENGNHGLAFGSGVAAIDAVIKLLQSGDEVIAASDMYGGTYRIFNKVFSRFGIVFHYVDMQDAEAVVSKINDATKLIWIETPANPLMKITDLALIAEIADKYNIWLCVDNTLASPYLQNPLDFGADIVLHSASKYLGGHSDVVQGCLVVNDEELYARLKFIQNSCGAIPGPLDCFLVLRGIKTLHVRMQRHCENADRIAHYLQQHPAVKTVYWCGFKEHPDYLIAKKQMRGFCGLMSFELKDSTIEKTMQFLSSTRLFTLAESLGGVESLINHPATMSHGSLSAAEKQKCGIVDSMIRISVGLEDSRDLIVDLEHALAGRGQERSEG